MVWHRCVYRRADPPGPFFFTLGLREPRGSVRFGLGGRFLRAWRFSFLRSALSLTWWVSIIRRFRHSFSDFSEIT